ncbi:hypothetical protein SAMN03159382_05896, partial [Pseudomonas sp. NFACC23-1]
GDAERHGMHYHAERGNEQVVGTVNDRSSRSAWERCQGRSAFRFWQVAQSVTGCITTQSVGTIKSPRLTACALVYAPSERLDVCIPHLGA